MKFEKNIIKLETFRLKVENLKSKEDTKIENLLKWRENLTKKSISNHKNIETCRTHLTLFEWEKNLNYH